MRHVCFTSEIGSVRRVEETPQIGTACSKPPSSMSRTMAPGHCQTFWLLAAVSSEHRVPL